MRIKKQNGNSQVRANQQTMRRTQPVVASTKNVALKEAIEYIHSAINALSVVANDDIVARESIANLSVVLLDLTSQSSSSISNQLESIKPGDTISYIHVDNPEKGEVEQAEVVQVSNDTITVKDPYGAYGELCDLHIDDLRNLRVV